LFEANQNAGSHTIAWDGRTNAGVPVASGIYLACLRGDGFLSTRKLILVK